MRQSPLLAWAAGSLEAQAVQINFGICSQLARAGGVRYRSHDWICVASTTRKVRKLDRYNLTHCATNGLELTRFFATRLTFVAAISLSRISLLSTRHFLAYLHRLLS